MQGRSKTVQEWIAGIPGGLADDNPWVLYWAGMCTFPFDIPSTRKYLEKSFKIFKSINDPSGIFVSWAGIVDTYGFALDEWRLLDKWMSVFNDLRETHPSFPSKEIDLLVSSRMLMALTLRKIDQTKLVQEWFERVSSLLQDNASFAVQTDIVFFMSVYYLWKGQYHKNALNLERAEAEILHRKPSPFAVIRIKLMLGIHYWVTAEYDSAIRILSDGLQISEQSGVRIYDSMLWSFRTAAEMASGKMELAEKSLKNQQASLMVMSKTLDIFFYHVNCAWHALLTTKSSLAVEHLEIISEKVEKMGTPYYRALWNIGMAQAEFQQNHPDAAKMHVQTAHCISLEMKSPVMEWYSLLISAYFLLQENMEKEGLASLRGGLLLGRKHGYVHLQFYQPAVMRFLYAKALEQAIEPDYVKGLIRKLGLTPPQPPDCAASACCLAEWPYPVKIYTFGRFEIVKNGQSLQSSGKVQKKPLEMLKALVAFGIRDVPLEQIADALWPDAEGDAANRSFKFALHQLRRLLGDETYIQISDGRVTLDSRFCYTDVAVFQYLMAQVNEELKQREEVCDERLILLSAQVLEIFKGEFLRDDRTAWSAVVRERFTGRFLRLMELVCIRHEEKGRWEQAALLYERVLEIHEYDEDIHRRLMLCLLKLDRPSAAMAAYKRCCRVLARHLSIAPSRETVEISAIIARRLLPAVEETA